MLGNLVNARDFQLLFERLPTRLLQLMQRSFAAGKARTIETYSRPQRGDQWWSVPAIQRRWNRLVTGDASQDHYAWIAANHLLGGNLRGMSIGCGEGARELAWARTGRFAKIVGLDLAPVAIERAQRAARAAGLGHLVEFRVGDVGAALPGEAPFDVVIAEHALHHMTPLRAIVAALRECLRPGGLFLIDEFVGPTRFQWTRAQLAVIDRLLALLPERLRRRLDGSLKRREYRPSRLYMQLNDPSEAVESADILAVLGAGFECVALRPYGGAVLHLLLAKIGHNFADDDTEAQSWLAIAAAVEDEHMRRGSLPSDFAVGVYRKA